MLHRLAGGGRVVAKQPSHQGRATEKWLAKVEGTDSVSSDSQGDLPSGMLKVNTSALRDLGGQENNLRESC